MGGDMFSTLLLVAAIAAQDDPPKAKHDPRTFVTTPRDAVWAVTGARLRAEPVGDLDGDGAPELVLDSNGKLSVHGAKAGLIRELDGLREPAFGQDQLWAADGATGRVANLDGGGQLVCIDASTGETIWKRPCDHVALVWQGDVDGDGQRDLTSVAHRAPECTTYSGTTGEPIHTSELHWPVPPSGARLQVVLDHDDDGHVDLLIGGSHGAFGSTSHAWVSGRTGEAIEPPFLSEREVHAIGDIDGDGAQDYIETSVGIAGPGNEFTVRSSSGEHPWTKGVFPDASPDYPSITTIGDIDGDGAPEVVIGDSDYTHRRELEGWRIEDTPGHGHDYPHNMGPDDGCVWVLSSKNGEVLVAIVGEAVSRMGIGMSVFPVGDQDGDGRPDVGVWSMSEIAVYSTGGGD